jgi:RHS repeat-associated protein
MLSDGHALYTPGLSENRGGTSRYYAFDRIGNLWTVDGSSKSQLFCEDNAAFGGLFAEAGFGTGFGGGNGSQTDADTGLILMGHRYYDTRIGRFLSQDPVGDGDNWYRYARNNPTNKIDPSGLYWAGGSLPSDINTSDRAEVEAFALLNDADPGQTFDVSSHGQYQYSFTISDGAGADNSGWALGLGVAYQFAKGTGSSDRYYGPTSTQAKKMEQSLGFTTMLLQIRNGQTHGKVDTVSAFFNTLSQFSNGTQAQLGAFEWRFTDPTNSDKGIDISNDITFNSLFYHLPSLLNSVPFQSADPGLVPSVPISLPTELPSGGPFGTIHQKIHLNYP